MRRLAMLLLGIASAAAVAHAAQRTLSTTEVDEAIRVGQTRITADRDRFHAPYRVIVSRAPIDYVDVVTPYRRVVLAAGERMQIGDRTFGQRQALELLDTARGQFDFVLELTFHPQNTFIGIPDYDVVLLRGVTPVPPVTLDRLPRFGARLDAMPPSLPVPGGLTPRGTSQPMLGGTVTARFAGDAIDTDNAMDVVLREKGMEVARATVDLRKLR